MYAGFFYLLFFMTLAVFHLRREDGEEHRSSVGKILLPIWPDHVWREPQPFPFALILLSRSLGVWLRFAVWRC
jgi:hypothetical protein